MLVVTTVKMSNRKKKVGKNTYVISSMKRVTRKFLEVLRFSRAKQWQKNVQKIGCTFKVAFLLIRPIAVFSLFSLPSLLSVTRLVKLY